MADGQAPAARHHLMFEPPGIVALEGSREPRIHLEDVPGNVVEEIPIVRHRDYSAYTRAGRQCVSVGACTSGRAERRVVVERVWDKEAGVDEWPPTAKGGGKGAHP
eukprot:scaffold30697_cov28-Tisochrysis_lutea.AAC.4